MSDQIVQYNEAIQTVDQDSAAGDKFDTSFCHPKIDNFAC